MFAQSINETIIEYTGGKTTSDEWKKINYLSTRGITEPGVQDLWDIREKH